MGKRKAYFRVRRLSILEQNLNHIRSSIMGRREYEVGVMSTGHIQDTDDMRAFWEVKKTEEETITL